MATSACAFARGSIPGSRWACSTSRRKAWKRRCADRRSSQAELAGSMGCRDLDATISPPAGRFSAGRGPTDDRLNVASHSVPVGRNWGAVVTVQQDHGLVQFGPYARARPPIYTGLIVMALGTAVNYGRALGFALLLACARSFSSFCN